MKKMRVGILTGGGDCPGLNAAVKWVVYGAVAHTTDAPKNPIEIIAQIRAGCKHSDNVEVVEDRHEAIVRALSLAEKGDVVLIAGKGHENYQEFANTVIPFDDRQVVRECMGISHA